jgi:hypothetical protein
MKAAHKSSGNAIVPFGIRFMTQPARISFDNSNNSQDKDNPANPGVKVKEDLIGIHRFFVLAIKLTAFIFFR